MNICLELFDNENFKPVRKKNFDFFPVGDEATLYDEVCQHIERKRLYRNNECYDWFIIKEETA